MSTVTNYLVITSILFVFKSSVFADELQRLSALESNYQLALERATKPITNKYIEALKKLKNEYTKAGNLKAANEADKKLKELIPPPPGEMPDRLSKMDEKQFKKWLSTVSIIETEGPYMIRYTFDRNGVKSIRKGAAPREHENAIVTTAKIFVPFSSTNATIVVHETLARATVSYSTGGKYDCKIETSGSE